MADKNTISEENKSLIKQGVPAKLLEAIDEKAMAEAVKIEGKRRTRESIQKFQQRLIRVAIPIKQKFIDKAIERAQERGAPFDPTKRRTTIGESLGQVGQFFSGREFSGPIPPVIGQPLAGGGLVGIPPAPPGLEVPPAGVPGPGVQPPIIPGLDVGVPPTAVAPPTAIPPIPLGQDPNLLTPEQNGPPLPTLGPQDLGPAPPAGVPTDPVTGLPPLPGLGDVPLPPTEGLPPLPPLPAESLEPAPVATPQSISLSQRMVPQATQQESQDIAEALDFISSGDPSFFDLDEGPVQELQEGPLGPTVG